MKKKDLKRENDMLWRDVLELGQKLKRSTEAVQKLRQDYGYQLLAEQAKLEEAGAKLIKVAEDSDRAWRECRAATVKLHRVYQAAEDLREALAMPDG